MIARDINKSRHARAQETCHCQQKNEGLDSARYKSSAVREFVLEHEVLG